MISITKHQVAEQTKALILAAWPWQPVTENAAKLITAYADAFGASLVQTLSAVQITNAIVLGGVSAPGGPLVGGLLTCTPGSVTSVPFDLAGNFQPPDFSLQFNGQVLRGEYTPWLRAFTSNLSVCLKQAWSTWYPLWSLSGFPCVNGGVSAWIPPAPPIVPAPGPWLGGTVTVPVSFNTPGQGSSASPAFQLLVDTTVLKAKSTPVTVPIQNSSPLTVMLCQTPEAEKMLKCITSAYMSVFNTVTAQVMLVDPTGASALGTATPPLGSIIGGSLPLLVLQ